MIIIGSKVRMTEDAIENYGEEYRNRILIVESISWKYMPAKEFFAKNKPDGYHPGYDEGAGGKLYDFENFNSSLYSWEIKQVK